MSRERFDGAGPNDDRSTNTFIPEVYNSRMQYFRVANGEQSWLVADRVAAGVTYQISEQAREDESGMPDIDQDVSGSR